MSLDQMLMAALSRPFALGMLYDARRDELIEDFLLWDKEMIKNNKVRQSQKSSSYNITASDSIQSKSSLLDVGASLSASFLGGLIEVGGSASYMNDNKKFKNQSRVTLQYKATTEYEHLNVTQVKAQKTQMKDAIKSRGATHVVTGILYGANAFFVFDSEKMDSSSVQQIGGSMHAVIKKIPMISIEGKVDIKLSEEEKDVTNKFSCKFYGDFILDSNPSTFEDAVKSYVELPQRLGENAEKTVPVKVWLTPLKILEPSAEELKADICVSLVRKAVNALDDMREIEMRCNDALDENVVKKFPPMQRKLRNFLHLCEDYTKTLKRNMEEKFPLIREGKEDEDSVHKVFDDLEKSPFSQENLDKWLDNVEREINVLTSCVNIMEGIKIVSDKSELDREVFAPGVEDALCFVFTSLETEDPYLKQMEKHLSCHETERLSSVTPPSKDHWFFKDQIFTDMRQKAKEFNSTFKNLKSSKKYSFVIAALPNQKHDGATIYHYRGGCLKTEDFSKPVPNVRSVTDRRELLRYFCNLSLDENTAYNYIKIDNRTAVRCDYISYPDHPDRFDVAPQILCKEELSGRHYWEVEWNTSLESHAGVAVAYKRIPRKGNDNRNEFGCNDMSWYFGKDRHKLVVWHNNMRSELCDFTQEARIGVFLDVPGQTLSFYDVFGDTLRLLHVFKDTFPPPLLAGMWIENFYLKLCPIDNEQ
ncbi:neoverrucotoxin subunit alpha isoform X2 [Oryzias melastigma]|uniref:Neoverrucotoxin subunit alpha-like n=2 Tax=Oryzias melastigma TaxID=30732 RepID=A0A3B3D3J9_ORYME|nr:neoverrucotoxin subunit alpha isoform X2 [Oryzias melastigma]